MPSLVKPLDNALAYTYCPTCRLNGNARSPLVRQMHEIKCSLGHSFTGGQLQSMLADMVPMQDIQPETPSITDEKWSIWINPKVRVRLEQKFPNRVIFTVATLLAALADDQLVMITGEQGEKLRKEHGIKSGAEMLAALESMKQTEQERAEAVKELDKMQKLIATVMYGANLSGTGVK